MSEHNDAQDRIRAVRTYDRNLVLVASAGTGKTSLLVERVLNQVIEQELSLTDLAAITFTEKAAAELLERIERGFQELVCYASKGAPPCDESREQDRSYAYLRDFLSADQIGTRSGSALRQLPHATIRTIHGFCSNLLRTNPLEAGVDPDFRIDEGGLGLALLRERIWERFLESEDGPEGTRAADWATVLRMLDVSELQSMAFQLSDFSLPVLPGEADLLPDAPKILAPLFREMRQEIDTLLGKTIARGPEDYLDVTRRVLAILDQEGITRFQDELRVATFRASRGERGLLEGDPPTSKKHPEATACAKNLQPVLHQLADVDDTLLASALSLLRPFAVTLREQMRRRGLLSYDALLSLTRDLLAAKPDLRRQLGRSYRVILVDEFQDTDPLQYEILFFLAEAQRGGTSEDPWLTELEPGKLFIVGDPKQSIYHFRKADIAAYHRAVAHVADNGGLLLSLTTNWRARPRIVAALNPLFAALLEPKCEADREVEPGYTAMESGREEQGQSPRIEIWNVGDGVPRRAELARIAEGQAIAHWIRSEREAGRLAYGDVAILMRALTQVQLYTRALHAWGVPHVVDVRHDPIQHPEGRQLHALLRALASPNDGPAVLGLLRSPLGGAPDRELLEFRRATHEPWSYTRHEPDSERFPNMARAYALLREWRTRALELPVDRLLACLLDETPLLALHAAADDGLHRVTILRRLTERLADLARRDPASTLAELLPWLEMRELLPPNPEEIDRVRVLSVHGAKGLEFPVVILPDLSRPQLLNSNWGQPELGWLVRERALAVCTGAARSASWVRHSWEKRKHERAESKRLFYVACTRARERLILPHAPVDRSHPDIWIDHLEGWGAAAEGILYRQVDPERANVAPPSPSSEEDWAAIVARTQHIAHIAQERARPMLRSPSGLREDEEARLSQQVTSAGGAIPLAARAVGIAVHEALERWDFDDPAVLYTHLESALLRACRDGADLARVREDARAVIQGFLASSLPAHLRSVTILARELPVLHRDAQGQGWSGTLDLLYRDSHGELVIADYKTDREPNLEPYRRQLALYAEGIARAFPQEQPRQELLFLRTGARECLG